MNVKEFRAWFQGFRDAISERDGLNRAQWERLCATLDLIEESNITASGPNESFVWNGIQGVKTVPLSATDPSSASGRKFTDLKTEEYKYTDFRGMPHMRETP